MSPKLPVNDAALRRAMTGATLSLVELMNALYGYVRQGYTATVMSTAAELTGQSVRRFERFARDHVAAWR